MSKKALFFIILTSLLTLNLFSQQDVKVPNQILEIKGDFFDRFEYSFGYNKLFAYNNEQNFYSPRFYTALRGRLIFDYYLKNKLNFHISLQDINFYGLTPENFKTDLGEVEPVYEVWGNYQFNDNLSLKVGRMELAYGKERILGKRQWLPQGLTHNAIVFAFESTDIYLEMNLGAAYDFYNPLKIIDSVNYRMYKAFEFFWLAGGLGAMSFELLALNTSLPEIKYIYSPTNRQLNPVSYAYTNIQTAGIYANIGRNIINFDVEFYYQTGRYPNDWIEMDSLVAIDMTLDDFNALWNTNFKAGPKLGKKVNAYMFSLIANLTLKSFILSIGYDYLSGDNYLETGADNNEQVNAFDPYLGSNHNFYGSMDLFYYNNWTFLTSNFSPGLKDAYLKTTVNSKLADLYLAIHYFAPAGTIYYSLNGQPYQVKNLGYELDLALNYWILTKKDQETDKRASINLGISVFKPMDEFIYLLDFTPENTPKLFYHTWISFRFKPQLFYQKIY